MHLLVPFISSQPLISSEVMDWWQDSQHQNFDNLSFKLIRAVMQPNRSPASSHLDVPSIIFGRTQSKVKVEEMCSTLHSLSRVENSSGVEVDESSPLSTI